jgi:hypothetical protein
MGYLHFCNGLVIKGEKPKEGFLELKLEIFIKQDIITCEVQDV